MKKFLTILAVAGVMTACNDGNDETTNGDSLNNVDTTTVIVPDTNTVVVPDTTKPATDTTKK